VHIDAVMCSNTVIEFSEITQCSLTAITVFKVIQSHRFWYQSQNLPPILHCLQVIADCWSNFR